MCFGVIMCDCWIWMMFVVLLVVIIVLELVVLFGYVVWLVYFFVVGVMVF